MTTQERENAAIDAIILDALRRDGMADEELIANPTMSAREKTVVANLDIDIEKIIAKAKRLRHAYTTAPSVYDGFGTVTLADDAGTDSRGKTLRLVGIEPGHWRWQTQRYGSGCHAVIEESEAKRYPEIWRLR